MTTYRFHHRTEGWTAACEHMDRTVNVGFYATEAEARFGLNKALGQAGLAHLRLNGAVLEQQVLPKDE
jgi:hypothetical protein